MNNMPHNNHHDHWGSVSLLLFSIATAACLYVGNCFRSYYLVLGMILVGLFVSILYMFIPLEVDERPSSIKNNGDEFGEEKPSALQYTIAITVMISVCMCVVYILVRLFEPYSSDSMHSDNFLDTVQNFIDTLLK